MHRKSMNVYQRFDCTGKQQKSFLMSDIFFSHSNFFVLNKVMALVFLCVYLVTRHLTLLVLAMLSIT